jgi:replicative DNA helicase
LQHEEIIRDIAIEGITIGYIYRNPEILNEYLELIVPEYDFSDDASKFLYNLLVNTYINHDKINETSINIQASKMTQEQQDYFKQLGGNSIYKRLSNISETKEHFKSIYEKLKVYNVLRDLDRRGFAVRKHIDKLKDKNVDQILKAFELQIMKVGSYIKNINEGVRIGNDIVEHYENLKKKPDFGINLPFPLLSDAIRGLRLKTIGGIGLNSGYGKSRFMVRTLVHTSIIGNSPVLVIANEQNIIEWNNMILTCVVNNIFAEKHGNLYITEDEIARGTCNGAKDEMIIEAAKYIQQNSKIIFFETNIFDLSTLRMIMRKHQLRDGIKHFIVDTYKPYHSKLSSSMSEWQQYTYTTEQLKEFAKELNINITFTFQLTDATLQTGELNSNSISNGKHIYHHLDFAIFARELSYNEKEKYKVKINIPGNPFNDSVENLDIKQCYYVFKIAKNRAGPSNVNIAMKVNRGRVTFEEIGFLIKGL